MSAARATPGAAPAPPAADTPFPVDSPLASDPLRDPLLASLNSLKRSYAGAKRAMRLSADYALTPKRLDFEDGSSSSDTVPDDDEELSTPIKENLDPVAATPVRAKVPSTRALRLTRESSSGRPLPTFFASSRRASPAAGSRRTKAVASSNDDDDSPTTRGVRSLAIGRKRCVNSLPGAKLGSAGPASRVGSSRIRSRVLRFDSKSPSPPDTPSCAAEKKRQTKLSSFFNGRNNNNDSSGGDNNVGGDSPCTTPLRRRSAPAVPTFDDNSPVSSPLSTPTTTGGGGHLVANRARAHVRRVRPDLVPQTAPAGLVRRAVKRSANVNPFAPSSLSISNSIKRAKLAEIESIRKAGLNNGGSFTTPTARNSSGNNHSSNNNSAGTHAGGDDGANVINANNAQFNPFNSSFHEAVAAHEAAAAAERASRGDDNSGNGNFLSARLDFSASPVAATSAGDAAKNDDSGNISSNRPAFAAPLAATNARDPAPTPPPGYHPSVNMQVTGMGPDLDPASPLSTKKRVPLSDVDISRYRQEFLELETVAAGEYGTVKVARHRLDGMVYAIKVTKHRLSGTGDSAVLNEVFAHSAMLRHRHVVRYYSSWVERGHVFIQTEFCDGGSLASVLRKRRAAKRPFQEWELRRLCLQMVKGLQYMHGKRLVHLDIKPDNILIDLTGDSGTTSGNNPGEDEAAVEGMDTLPTFTATATQTQSSSSEDGADPAPATPVFGDRHHPTTAVLGDMNASGAAALGCQQLEAAAASGQKNADDPMSTPRTSKVKKACQTNVSSDSGHASDGCKAKVVVLNDDDAVTDALTSTPIHKNVGNGNDCTVTPINNVDKSDKSPADCKISYKIGDLGHVASLDSEYVPEEGDCRYMAPELLLDEVDRERLPKADVFSLALTLYECATLAEMPRNSTEGGSLYESLRSGFAPGLEKRSKDFQHLIRWMTQPEPLTRPSAGRLLSHPFLRYNSPKGRSNRELAKELSQARQRLKELEMQLALQKYAEGATAPEAAAQMTVSKRVPVGRGAKKSISCYQLPPHKE